MDSPEICEAVEEIAAEQRSAISVVNALEVEPDKDTEALKRWTMAMARCTTQMTINVTYEGE